jgi:hypothetical protein
MGAIWYDGHEPCWFQWLNVWRCHPVMEITKLMNIGTIAKSISGTIRFAQCSKLKRDLLGAAKSRPKTADQQSGAARSM